MAETTHFPRPPQLGDVTLVKSGAKTWRVERDGETVASDLAFAQVLAVITGDVDVDELVKEDSDVH